MLIGRTQESNDFFGGFPDRLVSEFIKSDFKMPKAFKGINYGGAGSILDINKFMRIKLGIIHEILIVNIMFPRGGWGIIFDNVGIFSIRAGK